MSKMLRMFCRWAYAVVEEISKLLESMQAGGELTHLTSMARAADYRGSDVHLLTQTLVEGCRQAIPYPAFAWDWKEVQAYRWAQTQHINALEFAAFLTFVRSRAGSVDFHKKRFFHVFDSRVISCVVAKGRSSSRLLNRLCRRYAGFALAADLYVLTLWTISSWNHADGASRRPEASYDESAH